MSSNLDMILSTISEYSAIVVPVLLILICVTGIGILVVSMRAGKRGASANSGGGSFPDMGELEGTLKKVLESTEVRTAGVSTQVSPDGNVETVYKELPSEEKEQLESAIAAKEAEIEKLKTNMETLRNEAQNSSGDGELPDDIKAKIEELEARLAEYEIIEDDIADLSMYKEENAQLKAEIEALRSSSPESGGAEEPASIEEALAEDKKVEEPAAEAEAAEDNGVDDDIMAEFAAAVENQKAGDIEDAGSLEDDASKKTDEPGELNAESPVESATESPVDPSDSQAMVEAAMADIEASEGGSGEAATPVAEEAENPKIMAEFAEENTSTQEVAAEDSPEQDEGPAVDADAVLSELASFGEGDDSGDDNALESTLDTDKLVAEASEMDDSKE